MANVTITVDAELLQRARVKAVQEGTSVNAILRRELERYADADRARAAAWDEFLRIADETEATPPAGSDRGWTRESIQRHAESSQ